MLHQLAAHPAAHHAVAAFTYAAPQFSWHAHNYAARLFVRVIGQDGLSIMLLKRMYAQRGMLEDEFADLPLIKVDTIEDMCAFLSGAAHSAYVARVDEEESHRGGPDVVV